MSYSLRKSERDIPIVTTGVCIFCAVIFLQLQFAHTWEDRARWGYYPENAVYTGKYWVLVTSAFVHRNPLHLIFNLYWLWALGGAFERTFGALRWILFVFAAAFVSSGLQLLSGNMGIGFSGAGYAFFGFAWVTKGRYPEFARLMDKRTIQLFIGWGILCFAITESGVFNFGNYAHRAAPFSEPPLADLPPFQRPEFPPRSPRLFWRPCRSYLSPGIRAR